MEDCLVGKRQTEVVQCHYSVELSNVKTSAFFSSRNCFKVGCKIIFAAVYSNSKKYVIHHKELKTDKHIQ